MDGTSVRFVDVITGRVIEVRVRPASPDLLALLDRWSKLPRKTLPADPRE